MGRSTNYTDVVTINGIDYATATGSWSPITFTVKDGADRDAKGRRIKDVECEVVDQKKLPVPKSPSRTSPVVS